MTCARSLKATLLCAAITLGVVTAAPGAEYAPIDCTQASNPAEREVCRNYSLGQAEARLTTLYGVITSLVAMGQRGNLVDAQREWIQRRDACGDDSACLADAYARRIQELNAALTEIASRGPF